MSEIKQYEITTIADLLKVPDDKLDECLADLKLWLDIRRTHEKLPEVFREMLSMSNTMVWNDDGVRGISINIVKGQE